MEAATLVRLSLCLFDIYLIVITGQAGAISLAISRCIALIEPPKRRPLKRGNVVYIVFVFE